MTEFKGHPQLAEPGCWGVDQLRDPVVEPGSQHQQPDPFGSLLLLSAGERGNSCNTSTNKVEFHFHRKHNGKCETVSISAFVIYSLSQKMHWPKFVPAQVRETIICL